jgi:hypothetical protein
LVCRTDQHSGPEQDTTEEIEKMKTHDRLSAALAAAGLTAMAAQAADGDYIDDHELLMDELKAAQNREPSNAAITEIKKDVAAYKYEPTREERGLWEDTEEGQATAEWLKHKRY